MGILSDIDTNIIGSDVYLLRNRIFEKAWADYACVYSGETYNKYYNKYMYDIYSSNFSWIFIALKNRLENLTICDLYNNFNFSMNDLKMFCDIKINDAVMEFIDAGYSDTAVIIGHTTHNTIRRKPVFFVFDASYNNAIKYIETGKLKTDIYCDYLPSRLSVDMHDVINGTSMLYNMLPDILNMEVSMDHIDTIINNMNRAIMKQRIIFSKNFYEDLQKFIMTKLNI